MSAQAPGCGANVPFFVVDLRGNPDSIWVSPAVSRLGNCCGTVAPDQCVSFEVWLDAQATGINLGIYSGTVPAPPNTFKENCGANNGMDTVVCMTGAGPHYVTYCKPGSNLNMYRISSIAKPIFQRDDSTRIGCFARWQVQGLVPVSTTWHSVFPGGYGAYDSYITTPPLTNDIMEITPGPGAPPFVDYQICGFPIADECGYTSNVCDTVRLYIFQPFSVSITPNPARYCSSGPGVMLHAIPGGSVPPFTYVWKDPGGTIVSTSDSCLANTAGVYSVEVSDRFSGPKCGTVSMSVQVGVVPTPVVQAGPDQVLCPVSPVAHLNGTVFNATGGQWSGGAGSFAPSANFLTGSYTPTPSEIAAGFVDLYLTSTGGNPVCNPVRDTLRLVFGDTLVVNIPANNPLCYGDHVVLNALVTSGNGSYSFLWDNGDVTANTSVNAGAWCVTVTDALGCSTQVCQTVTNPPMLTATLTSTNASTIGGSDGSALSVPSGGNPPYTHHWNTGANTASITNLPLGLYTDTLRDANGCLFWASTVVSDPRCTGFQAWASGSAESCFGDSLAFAIVDSVHGGMGPYNYHWQTEPPQNNDTAFGLPAGIWTVVVTDMQGCSFVVNATITEPPQLENFMTHTNVVVIGAATGTATANPAGGTSPYSYLWSNAQTGQTDTALVAGGYTVQITDALGCSITDSVLITEPPCNSMGVAITHADVSCHGGNNGQATAIITNGTPPLSYMWNNLQTTQSITNLSAGNYNVTASDSLNCTNFASISITEPSVLSLGVSFTNPRCFQSNDGSIDLTVTGGTPPYMFSWSNYAITEDQISLRPGSYSVIVTDANGCTGMASATLTEPPAITASVTVVNVTCHSGNNGSVDLSASGGAGLFSYLWSNSATTQDISGLISGGYTVTITDANLCTVTYTALVDQPDSVKIDSVTYACPIPGQNTSIATVFASGGYGNPWEVSFDNGLTYGVPGDTTEALLAGTTYNIVVRDSAGCRSFASVQAVNPLVLVSAANFSSCHAPGADTTTVTVLPSGGSGSPWSVSFNGGANFQAPGDYDSVLFIGQNYTLVAKDSLGCASPPFSIFVPDSLQLSFNPTLYQGSYNIHCHGGNDAAIDLSVNGGDSSYTYSWSNGATTQDISALTAGTYTVTVTDGNGCSKTASFTITEPPALTLSLSPSVYAGGWNISCNGLHDGSITSLAGGGTMPYHYLWSNAAVSPNLNALGAGNYVLTLTDTNGCIIRDSALLTEPPVLAHSLVPAVFAGGWNISCFNAGDGAIDLTLAGGTGPFTYAWSNGASTQDISAIPAGMYVVSVSDANGCGFSDSVQLNEPPTLNLTSALSVYNGGWNISCQGATDGSLNLTVTGGTPGYAYLWSNASTQQDLNSISAGNYSVTVTDTNGCTDTLSATLNEPPVLGLTLTSPVFTGLYNVSCFGAADGSIDLSPSGGTPAYTYAWSNGSAQQDLSGLSGGSYSVVLSDANGCSATDTIVLNEPPAISTSGTPQNVACYGDSSGAVDLTVSGGVSPIQYLWSNGFTGQDPANLPAGNYTVFITDSLGCRDTFTLGITQNPDLILSSVVQNVSCNGMMDGAIDLSVSGGLPAYSYFWSDGSSTQDVQNLPAGNYSVIVTDNAGCSDSLFADVTEPPPILADAGTDISTCDLQVQLHANAPASGQAGSWSLVSGNGTFSSTTDPAAMFDPLVPGQYILVWTLSAGACTASDTLLLTLKDAVACNIVLEMPTGYTPNGDGANDYFVVHGIEYYPDNNLTVFNRWGNPVYERNNYRNQWYGDNRTGDALPDGTYYVILNVNSGKIVLNSFVDMRR